MKTLFRLTAFCAALSLSTTAVVAIAANAEQETGLRVFPPTKTELFTGQRFDLRVESQIPAREAPKLMFRTCYAEIRYATSPAQCGALRL